MSGVELPCRFGRFELLERIAVGGMAEVFLARATGARGFQRRLVIKRILPGLARSPRFLEMFIREARLSALLSHPNVVQVYDLVQVGDDLAIAMEYIHGCNLTTLVRRLRARGDRLPLQLAVHVAACLASALGYAHRLTDADGRPLGIVHRDVSPHNVMISYQGEVKLVDFGVARLAGDATAAQGGLPGGGKFAYMSPEQASGQPIDHRSDIFSLGIVLYELLVNRRLFQAPDREAKLALVRNAVVPDPRREVIGIPDALWHLLASCLARDPADRPEDAGEVARSLRAILLRTNMAVDTEACARFVRDRMGVEVGAEAAVVQLEQMVRNLGRREPAPLEASASGSFSSSLRGGDAGLAERRSVVVLAGTAWGLTEIQEGSPPRSAWRVGEVLEGLVRRAAARHAARVQVMGDGAFLLVFGVPRAQEGDLERACACARNLLGLPSRHPRLAPLALAVGIDRGTAVYFPGSDAGRLIAGDGAMRHARRLADLAEPGTVLVSEAIAAELGARWRFEPGPDLPRPGAAARHTFRLLGRRRKAGSIAPGRWIPRADELDRLGERLADLARGRGGVVVLRGETGSGKSHLVRELGRMAVRVGVPFHLARAEPGGVGHPLRVFRDLVGSVLGVDDAAALRERLALLRDALDEGQARLLAGLFGERVPRGLDAGPDAMLAAGLALIRGVARQQPMVLAVEDAHRLEGEAAVLLLRLLDSARQGPVLWLLTLAGPLEGRMPENAANIDLGPLRGEALEAFVAWAAGAEQADPAAVELVARVGGTLPLYVRETVTALAGAGRLEVREGLLRVVEGATGTVLPASLADLVAVRLDALDGEARRALRLLALVGDRLRRRLVAAVVGAEGMEAVGRLVEEGLLVDDGEELVFASRLVWDVVRRSTVEAPALHARIAEALEEEPDRERHLAALVHHHAEAGNPARAAGWAEQAGDRAEEGGFLETALRRFRRAADLLSRAEAAADPLASVRVHLKWGRIAHMLGRRREAERCLLVALEMAAERGDALLEAGCHLELARVLRAAGRSGVTVRAHLEQALALSRGGDVEQELACRTLLATVEMEAGRLAEAREQLRLARALAGDRVDLAAEAHLALGRYALRADRRREAIEHLQAALELARGAGMRILEGSALNNIGLVHHAEGRYDEALAMFEQAMQVRRDTGYRPGAVANLHNIAETWLRKGDLERAMVLFTEAREAARDAGMDAMVRTNEIFLGYIEALRGGEEAGMARLRRAAERAGRAGDAETALTGAWLEGCYLLAAGREAEGRARLEEALADARRAGTRWIAIDIERTLRDGFRPGVGEGPLEG